MLHLANKISKKTVSLKSPKSTRWLEFSHQMAINQKIQHNDFLLCQSGRNDAERAPGHRGAALAQDSLVAAQAPDVWGEAGD